MRGGYDMSDTKRWGLIDINRLIPSAAIVLLFTSIHLTYLIPGSFTSAFYYVVIFILMIVMFGARDRLKIRMIFFWALGATFLSLLNTIFVGNQNLIRTGILFAAFFLAALILNESVDENAFAISVYINSILVLIKVLQVGTRGAVYEQVSNNYVSILLLSPAVIYYAVCSARNRKCIAIPAICCWGLSFLMGGRGGVLSTSILLVGVVLHLFFKNEATRRDRVILGLILCAILIPALIVGFRSIFESDADLYIINRFSKFGMEGGRRIDIWNEYFEGIGRSWKAFFLGVDQSTLYWAQPFGGNLHSSFLFVHAYLGIIGFIAFIGLLIRAAIKAIQSGKWLYFCALLTFAFRGTTDHVFGANRITAIILALILLPDFIELFGPEGKIRAASDIREVLKK